MLSVSVHTRAAIEAGHVDADGLISISGTGQADADVDVGRFDGRVLRLRFDDVPCLAWTDARGRSWRGPTENDVREAIWFTGVMLSVPKMPGYRLAVHCEQGKSRSAAIAVAVLAAFLAPRSEDDAVSAILAQDTDEQFCFNPGIIRIADRILGRGNAIETALAGACPRFVTWRAYWQRNGGLETQAEPLP